MAELFSGHFNGLYAEEVVPSVVALFLRGGVRDVPLAVGLVVKLVGLDEEIVRLACVLGLFCQLDSAYVVLFLSRVCLLQECFEIEVPRPFCKLFGQKSSEECFQFLDLVRVGGFFSRYMPDEGTEVTYVAVTIVS